MPGSHAWQQPGSSASTRGGGGVLSPAGTSVPAHTLRRLKTSVLETKAAEKSHLSGLPGSGFRPASADGQMQSLGLRCRLCHSRAGSQPGPCRRWHQPRCSSTSEAAPSLASVGQLGWLCPPTPSLCPALRRAEPVFITELAPGRQKKEPNPPHLYLQPCKEYCSVQHKSIPENRSARARPASGCVR